VREITVRVSPSVDIACWATGAGPPVVCLPGWSQAAGQFLPIAEQLSSEFQVVGVDHRGHGRSSQPAGGYRLHRLAADLREVLIDLDLDDVTLLGHSMGVAVVWAYVDLFGTDRVTRLVLADQRPTLVRQPEWSDDQARVAGGTQTFAQLADMCRRLRSDEGWDTLVEVLGHMTSPRLPADRFQALVETNRATTNATRAALWFDQCTKDWRDLIPTIEVPTLVVHGLGSMIPIECQQWVADSIAGAQFATMPAESGGSHFAFWENPALFAEIVGAFLNPG